MNGFMKESAESRHRNFSDRGSSPGLVRKSPVLFNYTILSNPHYRDVSKVTEPIDYWAYQPNNTRSISSHHSSLTSPLSVPVSSGDLSARCGYTTSGCKITRSRMYSLPMLTPFGLDLSLVDDVFTTLPQTAPNISEPQESKGTSLGARGWSLEVSIDSTMPSSPALQHHKSDSFDLTCLQSTLPISSTQMVTKKPPSAVTTTNLDSCLLNKLMPSPSDETYSRKVFIGGLPPDIDQEEIRVSFQRYGAVTIDWPHKIHSKSRVPPKVRQFRLGYAFLLFKEEASVHKLLASCVNEGDKLFAYIKYNSIGTAATHKKCQIRPWKISDSYFFADNEKSIDNRKAVFVGGVPRPLKAAELAEVMSERFGTVSFVAIDCDSELKYPKGAGCVVFQMHASYIAAVSSRFMQLIFGSIEKKVEIKPYILEDQLCDECNGIQSDGLPAPFFCGSVTCLKYYCEPCWATYHSLSGRQNHRPMFKDIFDRDKFS